MSSYGDGDTIVSPGMSGVITGGTATNCGQGGSGWVWKPPPPGRSPGAGLGCPGVLRDPSLQSFLKLGWRVPWLTWSSLGCSPASGGRSHETPPEPLLTDSAVALPFQALVKPTVWLP